MAAEREFKQIYDTYYRKIFLYLTRIAGENDAEDLTQDVFDKVNKGIKGFQEKSGLSTWIYRIATNTAIDRFRSAAYKHGKDQIPMDEDSDPETLDIPDDQKSSSTDQLVIQKEMIECINEYLETLPHEYKTVLVLSDLEGLTNREISEILDISLDNVKIRLHRARVKLRTVLNDACDFYYTDQNTLACDRKQTRILPKIKK